jgi:hypothetical protein
MPTRDSPPGGLGVVDREGIGETDVSFWFPLSVVWYELSEQSIAQPLSYSLVLRPLNK